MFAAEIGAGLAAGSASLQADALDFLGDSGNYGISLFVVGMALRYRDGGTCEGNHHGHRWAMSVRDHRLACMAWNVTSSVRHGHGLRGSDRALLVWITRLWPSLSRMREVRTSRSATHTWQRRLEKCPPCRIL